MALNNQTHSTMSKYLNPKVDLTFKRVFGEHPNLVGSLLNSLLPLPAEEEIADIGYMSSGLFRRRNHRTQ